jgi:hypothetical protein
MCLYECLQQITRRDNHGTYLNHMQYDRQAKTSQTAFIHEIEKPATMKMLIWNAQQMAKMIDNRAATKCSRHYKISLQRLDKR